MTTSPARVVGQLRRRTAAEFRTDENGVGAMPFAVLAAAGQIERNHIRENTLEGQGIAAAKRASGGRPKVRPRD
ncbi:hypothetical protein [Streptomyces sp. NPDC048650]|uniref:hypothetical protein n=1 Tax=Streptomyces sp. NPDC048650 TaxID=3365583 RepID=UPI003724101F